MKDKRLLEFRSENDKKTAEVICKWNDRWTEFLHYYLLTEENRLLLLMKASESGMHFIKNMVFTECDIKSIKHIREFHLKAYYSIAQFEVNFLGTYHEDNSNYSITEYPYSFLTKGDVEIIENLFYTFNMSRALEDIYNVHETYNKEFKKILNSH